MNTINEKQSVFISERNGKRKSIDFSEEKRDLKKKVPSTFFLSFVCSWDRRRFVCLGRPSSEPGVPRGKVTSRTQSSKAQISLY